MSKKSKKEKKLTFPQSVAVRFDIEDDTDSLMIVEKTAEDHYDMGGSVTVGIYELKKVVRIDTKPVITILTQAMGK